MVMVPPGSGPLVVLELVVLEVSSVAVAPPAPVVDAVSVEPVLPAPPVVVLSPVVVALVVVVIDASPVPLVVEPLVTPLVEAPLLVTVSMPVLAVDELPVAVLALVLLVVLLLESPFSGDASEQATCRLSTASALEMRRPLAPTRRAQLALWDRFLLIASLPVLTCQ